MDGAQSTVRRHKVAYVYVHQVAWNLHCSLTAHWENLLTSSGCLKIFIEHYVDAHLLTDVHPSQSLDSSLTVQTIINIFSVVNAVTGLLLSTSFFHGSTATRGHYYITVHHSPSILSLRPPSPMKCFSTKLNDIISLSYRRWRDLPELPMGRAGDWQMELGWPACWPAGSSLQGGLPLPLLGN